MPAEDLAWLGLTIGAAAVAAAFVWVAPPLSKLYPSPLTDVFMQWRGAIDPEPLEDVRSVLALAAPVLLAAIVVAFGNQRSSRRSLDPLLVGVQTIGIGLLIWAVLEQPNGGEFLPANYFHRYLLSVSNLVAGLIIGIALTLAVVRPPQRAMPAPVLRLWERLKGWRWIPLGIAIAATVIWLLPAVVSDSTLSQAGLLASNHIPVQGEDYFAVLNGRTPLVDYIAQYANLLPLAIAPVLKGFGPSITSYSITMCVLSALGMLAIFGVFTEVTRRAWTGLALYLPWVALSLFPWNDHGPHREFDGTYYAIFPGRYLGPFVLAWLCAMSMRRRIPVVALFGFAGVVALNNYEFGIAAVLALTAAICVTWDRSRPLRERLIDLLLQGGAGLVAAVAMVCAIVLIRTGQLPDLSLLTYYNRLFLQDAYGLQPMPSLGLHWALYATYAAALLMAAVRYVRDDPDRTMTGMLAFSGVFGLVTGMYFVGRSSEFQLMLLFPAWGFALALVAWTAAGSLRRAGADSLRLRRLLLPGCVALIGLGVMISSLDRIPPPWRQIDRLKAGGPAPDNRPTEQFIESYARAGEKVLIIGMGGTSPDHLLADRIGVINVSPLNSVTSLISPSEADRALNQLKDEGGDQVFEAVSEPPANGFLFSIPEFATILRQHGYRLIADDPGLHLRVWRRVDA
jgi:hypothetical protein